MRVELAYEGFRAITYVNNKILMPEQQIFYDILLFSNLLWANPTHTWRILVFVVIVEYLHYIYTKFGACTIFRVPNLYKVTTEPL